MTTPLCNQGAVAKRREPCEIARVEPAPCPECPSGPDNPDGHSGQRVLHVCDVARVAAGLSDAAAGSMVVSIPSAALLGVDARRVDVEVESVTGLPGYSVVGLAATSIKEAAARIRSALRQCGRDLPSRKITVNLAPADLRKDGAAYDLPIALAIMAASAEPIAETAEQAAPDATSRPEPSPGLLDGLLVMGELGLDGSLRAVRGVLAATAMARDLGLRGVIVPRASAPEAALVAGVTIYAAEHLAELLAALDGVAELPRWTGGALVLRPPSGLLDFADVRGQALARRAAEIAAAGGHALLLVGPPGVGKTMIAARLPSILPPLTTDEAIEVTRVHSAAGLQMGAIAIERPFRAPHHTITAAALVGGGTPVRPGELSLAHRGVLFLDELPEFPRASLEALRQPLEERVVRIGRASGSVRLPALVQLVGSANPCPCGFLGSASRVCVCGEASLDRYRQRMSGPLLDRIDLQVLVTTVPLDVLRAEQGGESSDDIRGRVIAARGRQAARLAPLGLRTNAELGAAATREHCKIAPGAERVLALLVKRHPSTSARAIDRIVRVARTIADLAESSSIEQVHLAEAVGYRNAFQPAPAGLEPGSYKPPAVAFARSVSP